MEYKVEISQFIEESFEPILQKNDNPGSLGENIFICEIAKYLISIIYCIEK
jgi:hypothetical protein